MKAFKFCFSEGKLSGEAMSLICNGNEEFDIKQINVLNGQNIVRVKYLKGTFNVKRVFTSKRKGF
jgi:hypothetical protein